MHIEWIDSLLLFSHLYNNYDALATIQRHQIRLVFELASSRFLVVFLSGDLSGRTTSSGDHRKRPRPPPRMRPIM